MGKGKVERFGRSVAQGVVFSTISQGMIKVSNLIILLLVLYYFPPEEAGLFMLGNALFGLFLVITSFGIPAGVDRFTAYFLGKGDQKRIKKLFIQSVLASLIISIFIVLLSWTQIDLIAGFFTSNTTKVLTIILFFTPFTLLSSVLTSHLNGMRRYLATSIFRAGIVVINLVLLVMFIYLGHTTAEYGMLAKGMAYMITVIIESIYIVWTERHLLFSRIAGSDSFPWVEVIKYGIPIYITTYGSYLATWTDTFVLGHFVESSIIAGYSVISVISRNVGYMTHVFFANVLISSLSYLMGKGEDKKAVEVATRSTKWYFIVGTPILILILVFPQQIIHIMFSSHPEYQEYAYLFYILGPTYYTIIVSGAARNYLMAKGRSDVFAKVSLLIIFPNIILNFIFIPRYGLIGAAIATLLSFGFSEMIYVYEGKKYGVWFDQSVIKIILLSIMLGVLLYLGNWLGFTMWQNLLNLILLGGLYLILSYKLDILTDDDIRLLYPNWKKREPGSNERKDPNAQHRTRDRKHKHSVRPKRMP